jgi:hypothetical protein
MMDSFCVLPLHDPLLLVGTDSRVIQTTRTLVLQMTEELLYLLLCKVPDFHFLHAR